MFEVKAILPGAQPSHHHHPRGAFHGEPALAARSGAQASEEASRHHHDEHHPEPAFAAKEA
jgi:hypothetical protein